MYQSCKEKFNRKVAQAGAIIDNATGKVIGVVGAGTALVTGNAHAVAPATIADLTTGIDFSTVSLGVLAVSAALIAVYVTVKGAGLVIAAVRGR